MCHFVSLFVRESLTVGGLFTDKANSESMVVLYHVLLRLSMFSHCLLSSVSWYLRYPDALVDVYLAFAVCVCLAAPCGPLQEHVQEEGDHRRAE